MFNEPKAGFFLNLKLSVFKEFKAGFRLYINNYFNIFFHQKKLENY